MVADSFKHFLSLNVTIPFYLVLLGAMFRVRVGGGWLWTISNNISNIYWVADISVVSYLHILLHLFPCSKDSHGGVCFDMSEWCILSVYLSCYPFSCSYCCCLQDFYLFTCMPFGVWFCMCCSSVTVCHSSLQWDTIENFTHDNKLLPYLYKAEFLFFVFGFLPPEK